MCHQAQEELSMPYPVSVVLPGTRSPIRYPVPVVLSGTCSLIRYPYPYPVPVALPAQSSIRNPIRYPQPYPVSVALSGTRSPIRYPYTRSPIRYPQPYPLRGELGIKPSKKAIPSNISNDGPTNNFEDFGRQVCPCLDERTSPYVAMCPVYRGWGEFSSGLQELFPARLSQVLSVVLSRREIDSGGANPSPVVKNLPGEPR
ncbi:hypothetical protein Bbelb_067190 [Branchiostoma belcheri]|nr:hypothetical protein Bbelb_067190 [Branchiostoma belcheri]